MIKCTKCKEFKEEIEFYKNAVNSTGYESYCIDCKKEYSRGRDLVSIMGEDYYLYGVGALSHFRASASKRDLDFSLTKDSLKKWWLNTPDTCHYCGVELEQYLENKAFILGYNGDNKGVSKFKRLFCTNTFKKCNKMTVDRVNNIKGYSIDNIVKCCWICNTIKSDLLTEEQMLLIAPDILRLLEKDIKVETYASINAILI